MSDRELLLKAILDPKNDGEDLPRLMYADCVEDEEPERAEFIRLQCEMARVLAAGTADPKRYADPMGGRYLSPPDFLRFNTLRNRQSELIEGGRPGRYWTFAAPLPELFDAYTIGVRDGVATPAAWSFERGFVSALMCTAADWLKHGDEICAAHPVRKVTLTTLPEIQDDPTWLLWGFVGDPQKVMWARQDIVNRIGRTTPPPAGRLLPELFPEVMLPVRFPNITFKLPLEGA